MRFRWRRNSFKKDPITESPAEEIQERADDTARPESPIVVEDAGPETPVIAIPRQELILPTQDEIYQTYLSRTEGSSTWFGAKTPAYRFTNEPLADLLSERLNFEGKTFAVTASGDGIVLFAGMGAKKIDGVDVSLRASFWTEYKLRAVGTLPNEDFVERIASEDSQWKDFPFELPVSKTAREFMGKFRGSEYRLIDTAKGILNPYLFFDQGYAGSHLELAGYGQREYFERMQEGVQNADVRFFPSDLRGFFANRSDDEPYSLVYLSNVLDHVTRVPGDRRTLDMSPQAMQRVLEPIVENLDVPNGQIVLNLQWGYRAKPGAEEALSNLCGYKLRAVEQRTGGCGTMFIASR